MKRNYNLRKIKAKRSYTAEELAELLGTHVQTVRQWKRSGLRPLEETTTPHLFMGSTTKAYLGEQMQNRKVKLSPNQFYCLKCKQAVTPAKVQVVDRGVEMGKGKKSLVLQANCPVCGKQVNRFATEANIPVPTQPKAKPQPPKPAPSSNLTLFDF